MVMAKNSMALKNANKQTNTEAQAKSNAVMARMAIMIIVDLLGILALRAIGKDMALELVFYTQWLRPLTVVFGVLTALAAVYQVIAIVKKIDTSAHCVTPAMLLCIFAFCLVCALLYTRLLPVTIMIVSAVGTVLFVVYCLYMHVFYR